MSDLMGKDLSIKWLQVHKKCVTQSDYVLLSAMGKKIELLKAIESVVNTPMAQIILKNYITSPYNPVFISATYNEHKHNILLHNELELLAMYDNGDIKETLATNKLKDVTI